MRFRSFGMMFLGAMAVILVVAACGGGADSTATSAPAAPQPTAAPRPTPAPPPTATALPVPSGEFWFVRNTLRNQTYLLGDGAVRFNLDPMFDYIIGANADGELEDSHGLATSWESADGMAWTFKFREGVKFHNGDPATSEDVKFSFDWIRREESRVAFASRLRDSIVSMETPDDETLLLQIKAREIFFPVSRMSPLGSGDEGFLFPKNYMESNPPEFVGRNPIGSGPYRFRENRPGDRMIYEATDEHWFFGIPRFSSVSIVLVPEEATRLALLRAGDAEMAEVGRAGAVTARQAGLQVKTKEDGLTAHVRPHDQWKPGNPLGIVKVRQALSLAIDRQGIVDTFLLGEAKPTVSYVPGPFDPSYVPLPVPDQDLVRARQLLAEAGFPNGFDLNVAIHERTGVPEGEEIMEAISVWWEDIGLKVNRVPMTYSLVLDRWVNGTFDIPTVSGLTILNNRTVNQNMGASITDGFAYRMGLDPELEALGKQIPLAATLDEHIRLGREFGKPYADRALMPTIATIGQIFALRAGIDTEGWDLGKGQNSIRINWILGRPT